MKLRFTIAAALVALVAPAFAANYTVTNVVSGSGASDALFQAVNGSLLSGGIVAMGYFPSNAYVPSSSIGDIATTITDFTITASALAGSPSPSLGGSFPGYVEGDTVDGAIIPIGNALVGRALYVFVGNAATLQASTAFALKQIATIAADEPLENDYIANPFGGVPPVIGRTGTFTGDASGLGSSAYTTLQLAVPEPSTMLLGAIGALGLLRRRRN